MSNTPTRSIALTRELEAYIRTQLASGRYGNASEVVRTGLRLMMERDEARVPPAQAPRKTVRSA